LLRRLLLCWATTLLWRCICWPALPLALLSRA
jgi:hypothetical protein